VLFGTAILDMVKMIRSVFHLWVINGKISEGWKDKKYLKNAYRVLLTGARQGMGIVVPEGDKEDSARDSKYYDNTFNYLKFIGFDIIK
jgi:hypothetical protein